jgi:hypothetical protein
MPSQRPGWGLPAPSWRINLRAMLPALHRRQDALPADFPPRAGTIYRETPLPDPYSPPRFNMPTISVMRS